MSTSMKSAGLIMLSIDLGRAGGVDRLCDWVFVGLEGLDTGGMFVEEAEEELEEERTLAMGKDSVWGFTVAEESEGAKPDTWRISAVLRRDVRSSAATVISPLWKMGGNKVMWLTKRAYR